MTHYNIIFTTDITEAIYTNSNSNINLLQHNYNSHYTPSNIRNGDQSANHAGKRKRSWSRAVFSNLQRKGLEKRFEIQKYITKPDRRQLAATLGLTDAQVKVWFQVSSHIFFLDLTLENLRNIRYLLKLITKYKTITLFIIEKDRYNE
jgi:hypothetical protein